MDYFAIYVIGASILLLIYAYYLMYDGRNTTNFAIRIIISVLLAFIIFLCGLLNTDNVWLVITLSLISMFTYIVLVTSVIHEDDSEAYKIFKAMIVYVIILVVAIVLLEVYSKIHNDDIQSSTISV